MKMNRNWLESGFTLFFNADAGAAGGGGGAGAGATGGTDGAGTTGGAGQGTGDGGTGAGADKTFTQAEIDRIVADRLARQKGQFADYDDLKTKAAELEALKQSQMTEQEKIAAHAKELETQIAERDRQIAEFTVKSIKTNVLAEMGIPAHFADRVFGSTEAEIRADAEAFKQHLTPGQQGQKPVGGASNPGSGAGQPVDFRTASKDQAAAKLSEYGIRI
jgi:hypothetical protein